MNGGSPMLPDATLPVPASLASLLAVLGPLFTVPSFRTFCGLACGFLSQAGKRTVCGMLAGAGLSRTWPHDRAHRFFARSRWDPGELGLAVARLVVALLVPAGQPVVVAIDDTLFRRRGKKVRAASWFYDGSAPGPAKTGYGNTWVIAAVVVRLPAGRRPVAIPVLAKLVIKDTNSASRLWLARRMAELLAGALPGRHIRVVADSAYAGGELKKLPPWVTWTTRLRKDAALHGLPPQRTGRRGRPRQRGDRLPRLATLAATTAFTQVTVTRYGKAAAVHAAAVTCLWPAVFGARPVTVVLTRDRSAAGYDLALVTTDTAATAAQVIEQYVSRWSIEVAIEDARQVFGAGQARNRTARAVERTVPFQLACQAITAC
ncbi:MAG TPA: transposase [Streptosporangiaceae bacterium]